jgi:hypothetical protein
VGRLDLPEGIRYHRCEAVALFLGNSGSQVLDFNQPFADKDHESDIGLSSNPGVADKLGIEGQ